MENRQRRKEVPEAGLLGCWAAGLLRLSAMRWAHGDMAARDT